MVMKDFSIKVSNLELEFHEHVREGFFSLGKNINHVALKGIDLEIQHGDRLAILGRNGSGKSTLLRCMAGFHKPKTGMIETNGAIILLAGTDPGFDSQLTGRENIRELAMAYGILKSKRNEFVESVKRFTELGEDFERKFGNYSGGMMGKLGFGFISSIRPEILLVDETFGSGDLEFRKKATARMNELLDDAGTVVVCTHSLGLAAAICSSCVVLENGHVVFKGGIDEGIEYYESINKQLVDWIDLPYSVKNIVDDKISFKFDEEFGVEEDVRFVLHDDQTKGYPIIDIIPAGTDFEIARTRLPSHGEYKFKIQQERLNRWYDASNYIQIVESDES